MKQRVYTRILIAGLLVTVAAGVGRAQPQFSLSNVGNDPGQRQPGASASSELTQASVLSGRLNEVVALLKSPRKNPDGDVRGSDNSEWIALRRDLRTKSLQADQLRDEGRHLEALTLREEIVAMTLAAPRGQTPPISVYGFQDMEKLYDLYLKCGFSDEAEQFRAALDNLNALRPGRPRVLQNIQTRPQANVPDRPVNVDAPPVRTSSAERVSNARPEPIKSSPAQPSGQPVNVRMSIATPASTSEVTATDPRSRRPAPPSSLRIVSPN